MTGSPRLRWVTAALAGAVAVAVGGAVVAARPGGPAAGPTPTVTASVRAGYAGGVQDPVEAPPPVAAGIPVRVTIPQIGVDSDLEDLRTDPTGRLLPPARPGRAGWYGAGVVPGQVGPAIIAGHIDYSAGPGVFERLRELGPGSTVTVTMSSGAALVFRVTGSTEARKVEFPSSAVYGITPDPQLRLITCAGEFDRRTAHYLDNLVVFATLER